MKRYITTLVILCAVSLVASAQVSKQVEVTKEYAPEIGKAKFYGGLHCGTCMDVFVNNRWKPTRIELDWGGKGWYLVGVPTDSIVGLRVRM